MKMPTPAERRALRAQAHHLDPVVAVGQQGLTPAVLHEVDLALLKHELVKVRVFSDDRTVRNAMLEQICAAMTCAAVQHLGKVLVLWRPNPEKKMPAPAREAVRGRKPSGGRGAAKKSSAKTPYDPVRERRRGERGEGGIVTPGKGTRGAARNMPVDRREEPPAAPEPERRKSSFTPKSKPRSFSAKPNPRTAWEKAPTAGKTAASGTRRRRTTG